MAMDQRETTPVVMERYDGRDLGPRPHVAVMGSCKVGNFVATVPLLRALRRRYPNARVDFWGSEATRDFEEALCTDAEPLLNWRHSWDNPKLGVFQDLSEATQQRGAPDLVINCDGFNPVTQVLSSWLRPRWVAGGAMAANGRRPLDWGTEPQQRFLADQDWDSAAFLERYQGLLKSNYIAELLCQMAFLEPTPQELHGMELPWVEPSFEVPPLLIHCSSTRSAKIWPLERWSAVLEWCAQRDIAVGLVGAPPAQQRSEYQAGELEEKLVRRFGTTSQEAEAGRPLIDLRGKTKLIELAGACRKTKAMVTVDAGPLHIAAGVNTPVLAVVGNDADGLGASPIRLWLPRATKVSRTVSESSCDGCEQNRYRNEHCVADAHACMWGVSAEQVVSWLSDRILPLGSQTATP